jgi:class 3 adenylate cyclase
MTAQDRLTIAAIGAIVTGLVAYLTTCDANKTRHHYAINVAAFNAIFVIAGLGMRTDCGDLPQGHFYMRQVWFLYAINGILAPQLCFDVKIHWRFLVLMVSLVEMIALAFVRAAMYGDEAITLGTWLIVAVLTIGMSYHPEVSTRLAFAALTRLAKQRRSARTRTGVMTASALRIMLPGFVTDSLVASAREEKERAAQSDTASQATTATAMSAGSAAVLSDIDFDSMAATWHYRHVAVLFARLHTADADTSYNSTDATIKRMEAIVAGHGVLKVKTIGPTMMVVGNIDDELARDESIAVMLRAAVEIRDEVFRPLAAGADGVRYSIGINAGPAFGAVIGGNGCIFDIFGDTVNMASRMMSTAENGAIQLSAAAHACLPVDAARAFGLEALADVEVKGKGTTTVYRIA